MRGSCKGFLTFAVVIKAEDDEAVLEDDHKGDAPEDDASRTQDVIGGGGAMCEGG